MKTAHFFRPLLLGVLWAGSAHAAVIPVTTNGDSGPGTLRAAILTANSSAPPNTITFALFPTRISPVTPLPAITNAVLVDGTTYNPYFNFPLIQIDGRLQGGNAPGLTLAGTGIVVRALEIVSFSGAAVRVQGRFNTVDACAIRSNTQHGVIVEGNDNTIGGESNTLRNYIHDNADAGILISSGTGHRVAANWIGFRFAGSGLPPMGSQARGVWMAGGSGNAVDGFPDARPVISANGVGVEIAGASYSNTVRGAWFGLFGDGTGLLRNANSVILSGPSYGNVIGDLVSTNYNVFGSSSNAAIAIQMGASNNVVAGNWIGLNIFGFGALTNLYGVSITDARDNQVGVPGVSNVMNYCSVAAVEVSGTNARNNRIEHNRIGMSPDLSFTTRNGIGISLVSAPSNEVGPGNFVGGSTDAGVAISGEAAHGNRLLGNFIGVSDTGYIFANLASGIRIADAPFTWIGNGTATGRNVIANNVGNGLELIGTGTVGTVVHGNWIGVAGVMGTEIRSNRWNGIFIQDAARNQIGATGGPPNIVSGSFTNGILVQGTNAVRNVIVNTWLGLNAPGTGIVANAGNGIEIVNAPLTRIGGSNAVERNVIAGSGGYGILLGPQTFSNTISTCHIGTRSNGAVAAANQSGGIRVEGFGNTIGGAATNLRNVVSGNDGHGIYLNGVGASNNLVLNNYIGVGASGQSALGNNGDGVRLANGASLNVIGRGGAGNVIGDNASNGVFITGYTTTLNRIAGNLIGTYANGTSSGGRNLQNGIRLRAVRDMTLGGTNAGEGNLVSANLHHGMLIESSSLIRVWGNLIGTDISGSADLGNATNGVHLFDSGTNQIGGATAAHRNLISGNGLFGVQIILGRENAVQGNFIGTAANGVDNIGNQFAGVLVNASSNLIGGAAPGEGNRIAWAQAGFGFGVGVPLGTMGVTILGNAIFSNATVAIDLNTDGATVNDPAPDPDTGANGLQNYPVITNAVQGSARASGFLASSNSSTFRLEFFATGIPQGGAFLGATNVTTSALGTSLFQFVSSYALPTGALIHGTATDPRGNTSEFSPGVAVEGPLDADGDGMPDAWELENFGTLTNGAAGDVDGDGLSNLGEYIAHTQPTNAASLFIIAGIRSHASTGLVGVLPSAPGRFHQLEYATNLVTVTNWIATGPDLPGDGALLLLPDVAPDPNRSYRVRIRLP